MSEKATPSVFVLVNPPFVSLRRPNLGLASLKARLGQDGHPSVIYHADLVLAARWGPRAYSTVVADHDAMKGEWLFSGLVRGDWDSGFLDFLGRRGYTAEQTGGLEQMCRDLAAYLEQVADEIVAYHPSVVGCSSTFQQNNASLAILRAVKRRLPAVVTVMGGANLEGELAEPILGFPEVDYIVAGEAESCVSHLYELCLRFGRHIPVSELPEGVGCAASGLPARAKVEDLDSLPFPDFDDFYGALAELPGLQAVGPVLTLEGSRGCWWGQVKHCTFCGLNGSGIAYRAKSPQRLLDEIRSVSKKYGQNRIAMVDNIIAPRHLMEVLPELARDRDLHPGDLGFFWEVKANLKAAHFDLLRRAGVLWLQPGIESLSDRMLSAMRKGQRTIQNLLVLKAARENGIRLFWNLLIGHPGESALELRQHIDLIPSLLHLQPPSTLCTITADRFSPLFEENPELEPWEVYSYIYDLPPALRRKMAYYFTIDGLAGLSPRAREEYAAALRDLRNKLKLWQQAWARPEARALHFAPGMPAVVDRRWPGTNRTYELSEPELHLLKACEQPTRLKDLEQSDALPRLLEAGLCYRDATHALSLVLSREASQLPPLPPDL